MLFKFDLQTACSGLTDITAEVAEAVAESGVYEGICVVFCPHTTASIMLKADSDIKANNSETVIIAGGKLLLGKHQKIYFCERNESENRQFFVKIV
ncbi:MAG: YjbQ family protein [Ruminococcus flavefaciens]|nr:YjbQ family protein [Ruminococcus flavefaciens]MCM1229522.1 YjbQ family protein [Ruminococcus flavefaciens]